MEKKILILAFIICFGVLCVLIYSGVSYNKEPNIEGNFKDDISVIEELRSYFKWNYDEYENLESIYPKYITNTKRNCNANYCYIDNNKFNYFPQLIFVVQKTSDDKFLLGKVCIVTDNFTLSVGKSMLSFEQKYTDDVYCEYKDIVIDEKEFIEDLITTKTIKITFYGDYKKETRILTNEEVKYINKTALLYKAYYCSLLNV